MQAGKHENRALKLLTIKTLNVVGWALVCLGVVIGVGLVAVLVALLASLGPWVWAGTAGVLFGVYEWTENNDLRKRLKDKR